LLQSVVVALQSAGVLCCVICWLLRQRCTPTCQRDQELEEHGCALLCFVASVVGCCIGFFRLWLLHCSCAWLLESLAVALIASVFGCCIVARGGGLGSSTIFKKFNEPYAPS